MKNILWAICLLFSSEGFGQEQQHLFSGGKVTSGFGSFLLETAQTQDRSSLIKGFDMGLSVNKTQMGVYYIWSSDGGEREGSFSYRHIGALFGYNLGNHKIVHPYFTTRFGIGNQKSFVGGEKIGQTIIAIKPSLGLEVNIYEEMKLSIVASYNYFNRFELDQEIETLNLNGISYGVIFTWGWWRE